MGCRECHYWLKPVGESVYGWCRPVPGALPFWAKEYQEDMQVRTNRKEGQDCDLFSPRAT